MVYQFCRQSPHASLVMPGHGRFVGAASLPMAEHRRVKGELRGLQWRIPAVTGQRRVRHVIYDTNWWKSFVHARLAVAGDPGCLSLFGSQPQTHRLLAEQLTAEYFVETQGRGRSVQEWRIRPQHPDNHWLDCLVGTAVAASMQGCGLAGMPCPTPARRRHRRTRVSPLKI